MVEDPFPRECQTAKVGAPPVKQRLQIWVWVVAVLGLVLLATLWFLIRRGEIDQGEIGQGEGPLLLCPVADGVVKDNFGAPRADHAHKGDDILADWGAPVLATFKGRVYYSQSSGGLIVTLKAPDGSFIVGKHLSATTGKRRVQAGDTIGYVGELKTPGSLPHLHFEWHPGGGRAVDPSPYLSEVCSSTQATLAP